METEELKQLRTHVSTLMEYLLSLPSTTENYLARVRLVESHMWARAGLNPELPHNYFPSRHEVAELTRRVAALEGKK